MTLFSMRLPMVFTLGAIVTAWRAYEVAPEYSRVQAEMGLWLAIGMLLLLLQCFWELLRWYQRMDRRYLISDEIKKEA